MTNAQALLLCRMHEHAKQHAHDEDNREYRRLVQELNEAMDAVTKIELVDYLAKFLHVMAG